MAISRRRFLTLSGLTGAAAILGAYMPSATGLAAQMNAPALPADPAWHTLRRLTFGPRPEELARAREIGVEAWVEEQLAPEKLDDSRADTHLAGFDRLGMTAKQLVSTPREPVQIQFQGQVIVRGVYSRRQLYESMVDFWTDHFSILFDRSYCFWFKPVDDREVIRKHALGRFADLLWASMNSPAMLEYLDNVRNIKGQPNENYARELMELHSLGVDAGYTQQDVQEVARCLTGWTVNRIDQWGLFKFYPSLHDDGEKVVLGTKIPAGGGAKDVEQVHALIIKHPALPRFIARKLVRRFVADEPPAALVERGAEAFRQSDGDIKAVLRALFLSDEFRAAPPKYKRPLHFVVSALRQVNADTDGGPPITEALAQMGQPLFLWETPDGFPEEASAWKTNLLPRWQFAEALALGDVAGTRVDWNALLDTGTPVTLPTALRQLGVRLLGVELPQAALEQVAARFGELSAEDVVPTAFAVLASVPQFQWR